MPDKHKPMTNPMPDFDECVDRLAKRLAHNSYNLAQVEIVKREDIFPILRPLFEKLTAMLAKRWTMIRKGQALLERAQALLNEKQATLAKRDKEIGRLRTLLTEMRTLQSSLEIRGNFGKLCPDCNKEEAWANVTLCVDCWEKAVDDALAEQPERKELETTRRPVIVRITKRGKGLPSKGPDDEEAAILSSMVDAENAEHPGREETK